MQLRFRRVRFGTFPDGRKKLLVDFVSSTNEALGDWCPAWHEVERLVLEAVDVEQTNDGDYVAMLRKVEERLARRLPKLGIARHTARLHAYEPPNVHAEILDNDRPGWGPRKLLRLTCPIPQRLLDMVIEHALDVGLVVRDDALTDVRVQVDSEEESLAAITYDVRPLRVGSGVILVRAR